MKRTELFVACAAAAALLSCAEAKADGGIILGNINKDKAVHVVGVAGVVMVGTAITDDERWGLGAGVAVSAARELYKIKHPGYHASWLSIASDGLGLYVGHLGNKHFQLGVDKDARDKTRVTLTYSIPLE